jgi:hypothetical protein
MTAGLMVAVGEAADGELTVFRHALGVLACLLVVGPLWYGAVVWRRVLLPGWVGALARLAEAVAVSAVLLLLAQALGAVGLFRAVSLVIAAAITGGVAVAVGKGRQPRGDAPAPLAAPEEGRLIAALAAGTTVAVVSLYALEALSVLISDLSWVLNGYAIGGAGIIDFDSLSYHLPVAADFVQERSLLGLTVVGNPVVTFYPFNAEVLHAVSLALLGHDAFSSAINLIWLLVALLAGWSIGLPFGRPRLALIGVATVLGTPLVVYSQAGTANVDLMGLALALAAVAFVVNARGALWPLLLAFLSIGLLVGTKLPMVPTAAALSVVAIVSLPKAHRLRWSRWALLCLFLGGSFWYVRNVYQVDNPLPWVGLNLGLLNLPSLGIHATDCTSTPLIHWLDNRAVVAEHIAPQLDFWVGSLWPILLVMSVLGPAAAIVFDRRPTVRMLAAVAIFAWIAYLITPATGGERSAGTSDPDCFGYNLRFAIAPMSLGVVVVLLALPRKAIDSVAAAITALFVVTMLSWNGRFLPIALGAAIGLVALWRWGADPPMPAFAPKHRPLAYAMLVLCSVGAVAAALPVLNGYLDRRYLGVKFSETPLEDAAAWARGVEDASIGVGGYALTYPLRGLRATNSVSYVSQPGSSDLFSRPRTCDEWRRALTDGHFDYVVTAPYDAQDPPPAEAGWTRGDRRATEILSSGPLSVFSLDTAIRRERCHK